MNKNRLRTIEGQCRISALLWLSRVPVAAVHGPVSHIRRGPTRFESPLGLRPALASAVWKLLG
jgi:hypothetical protein